MRTTILSIGFAVGLGGLTACATSPDVATGEAAIYLKTGQGRPAVVLQAGYGDGKSVWQPVQAGLAGDFTVFSYDRPGYGANPDTDAPRDPCSIAAELRALLRDAGVAPPYLLLGHSLGGLYQYVYAKRYPDEVAGVVLLDPTHPRNWQMLKANAPATALLLETMLTARPGRARQGEFEAQTTCLDRLPPGPLTAPARVLVSRRYSATDKEFAPALQTLQDEWRAMAGIGHLDHIWDAGHYIQSEQPDAVIDAVRAVAGRPAEAGGPTNKSSIDGVTIGVSTQAEILKTLGPPTEKHQDGDHTIWVYGSNRQEIPAALSLIPILGDIADVVELAWQVGSHYESILQFDARGVVVEARRRKVDR